MLISILRILLLWFFKTITIILLTWFYGLFILLVRSLAKNLANAIFGYCDCFQVPKVTLGKNPLYPITKLILRALGALGISSANSYQIVSNQNMLSQCH